MKTIGSKLSCSKQQIWVCVVAGLLVSDFILCGYIPSRDRLESLREAQTQQQRTIMMGAAQGAELPKVRRRLRDTERMVQRYEVCIPAEETLGTFLQQMAGIMTEHHLTNQEVIPQKEWETDGLICTPVHVTCAGTLANLFSLFNELQALDRSVRIERVTLTNDSGFTGQISMRMEGAVFHQSPKYRKAGDSAGLKPAGGAVHGT